MAADKLYALLLRLYPAAFREEYEREMRAVFRRRWRDEAGAMGRVFVIVSVVYDTLVTAAGEHLEMLINDIRYTLRGLRKTPVFTVAVLITLALGIGATTSIFTLVHTVLLRPLPYQEPDRILRIWETNESRRIARFAASLPNFLSWQEETRSFEGMSAMRFWSANLTEDGEPERLAAAEVSPNFWTLTGLKLLVGRGFVREEGSPGKDQVAILGESLWQRRYGGDPAVIGRTILVSGERRVVVGVAPQDVGFSNALDLWTPLVPKPAQENRGSHVISALARLKPGVASAQAEAELNAVAASLEDRFPATNAGWRVSLMPVTEWIVDRESRTSLRILMGAVALLLVVACANVGGLLVTRASARVEEFGVRLALGAGRARLVRQFTTESLVLASIGGGLGILIALGAVQWLAAKVSNQLPRTTNITVEWPVLIFALGLTVAVGLIFGIAPIWSIRQSDLMMILRKAGRGAMNTTGARFRLALVGCQIALATMLVVGALLLIQSFTRLQRVELGFQPDHLLTANISLPNLAYPAAEKARQFYEAVAEEVKALPGVISAGVSTSVPLNGSNPSRSIVPVERPVDVPEQGFQVFWNMATRDYFETLKVPLIRGRLFDAQASANQSVILSENLARRLWPNGEDPIGRSVKLTGTLSSGPIFTVIGVVGNVRQLGLRVEPQSTLYLEPLYSSRDFTVTVRTAGDPARMSEAVRDAVKRVDPDQPVFNIKTMDELRERSGDVLRLQTTLLTSFAFLALLLGSVGVAGVVAYTVERRTPELALRLALGATPAQAMGNAARSGLIASLGGLLLGLIGAWALSRSMDALVFEMSSKDPSTFAGVAGVLLVVALLACWLPARRAVRIDPAVALKPE